jgi:hypothetical protein
MSTMVYVIVMSICMQGLYYYFIGNMSISSGYEKNNFIKIIMWLAIYMYFC